MLEVQRLDHLVLTVRDVEATCAFYERVLGMKSVVFAGNRRALVFGRQKINLHESGGEIEPKATIPTPGSADLCFVTEATPEEVASHLKACNIELIAGPVRRTGALGEMESVYLRDPDGNLIEVSVYPRTG